MKFKEVIIALVCAAVIVSCNNTTNEKSADKVETIETKSDPVVEVDSRFVIQGNSFMGVKPLDLISEHNSKFQTGKIKIGKVVKEVLEMEVDGLELGYVEPFKQDKKMIGNMTFRSPKVTTDKGIGVGNNLQQALDVYPNLKVKIAKKAERVYVTNGEIGLLLDHEYNGKSVTLSEVSKNSKILELKILAVKR